MARYSRVFRLFIASPLDISDFRPDVYEAAYRWNAIHSVSAEVLVEPVGWENHVRPERNMLGGQASIDTQLLDSSDFLLAIFHLKVGGSMRGDVSGTIHEIKRFSNGGKPTMIFFSADDYPQSIGTKDLERLQEFKEECKKSNLYKEFRETTLQSDLLAAISQHVDVIKNDFGIKVDAFQGLRASAPAGVSPRKFRFPKEVIVAEDVKFAVCFFVPELDMEKDPDNEWNVDHELVLDTWEVDRRVLFKECKGRWHYAFKFYVEVPFDRKQEFLVTLLESGLVLTGDGEAVGKDRWRIWFLHDEAPVHPHYTGTSFLNQSLFRLPISI